MVTLGIKAGSARDEDKELAPLHATTFRALAARTNVLAHDRAGIQSATTELCRYVRVPTGRSYNALPRLGLYVHVNKRCVQTLTSHSIINCVEAWVATPYK